MQRNLLLLLLLIFVGCKKEEAIISDNESAPAIEKKVAVTAMASTISPVPAGLPKRVAFGIEGDVSQRASFINEADYVYVYLAGEIFSNSWTAWNWPSGQYARNFLNQIGGMGTLGLLSNDLLIFFFGEGLF